MSITPPVRDAEAARYTDLASVYEIMGGGLAAGQDEDRDARMTTCIIAAESTIDLHMHRSMPDTDDAEGPQPPTLVVPAAWKATATQVAISLYKAAEAPFGTAGTDDWMGVVSTPQIVAETVRRNPTMLGWQVAWGMR